MTHLLPFALFGLFVVLAVIGGVFSLRRGKARQKAVQDLGFSPTALDSEWEQKLVTFYSDKNARVTALRNVAKKSMHDYTLYSFDISTAGYRRGSATRRPALAIVSPNVKTPFFALGSSTSSKGPGRIMSALIDYLATKAHMKRVVLDERPDFNDAYVLIGADDSAVRSLFDKQLVDWFVLLKGQAGMRGVSIAADNGIVAWAYTDALPGDSDVVIHLKDSAERISKLYQLLAERSRGSH